MTRIRVLFVEDDDDLRQTLLRIAAGPYNVEGVASAEAALGRAAETPFDVVVTDVALPQMSGIDLILRLLRLQPRLSIVVISGEATIDIAVEAMKRGALDFLTKPFAAASLLGVLGMAAARASAVAPAPGLPKRDDALVAESPAMQRVLAEIRTIAPYNTTVLVTGETGTGKELVARSLHQCSPRAKRPLVALNCAAIPEQLLEDELFGHVKGAFTGAQDARVGRFEQAEGGTLFLDEIADMALPLQSKLLRVLQEREFERVGSTRTIKTDVRIVAATSADVERRTTDGTFRPDLFYRLNVVQLKLPPLRARLEDIPVLADTLLAQFCASAGLPRKRIDPAAMLALTAYRWPGNIRQLRNAMERAAAMTGGASVIVREDLPEEVQRATIADHPDVAPSVPASSAIGDDGLNLDEVLRDVERRLLLDSLERSGGNKLRAARLLKMKRSTFAARLKRVANL